MPRDVGWYHSRLVSVLWAYLLPAQSTRRPLSRASLFRCECGALWMRGVLVVAFAVLPHIDGRAEASERVVDLELVLAADISASMDLAEAALQRRGFVEAVRHPEVIKVIKKGRLGRIAIAYMEWAGEYDQRMEVGWREVSDAKSAIAFAEEIGRLRLRTDYWTSISKAITFTARSFEGNGFYGRRRIIDISGDGPNNNGPSLVLARDRAVKDGIIINGLPIINDRLDYDGTPRLPNLDLYYAECVIGGRGSFVVVAHGFRDFARAIRQKMVLEIADRLPKKPRLRLASSGLPARCG